MTTPKQIESACIRAVERVLVEEFQGIPPWEGWHPRLSERLVKAVLDAERLASVDPEVVR